MPTIGSHCVLEMYGCPSSLINDLHAVQAAIREAAKVAQSTLLNEVGHRFEPQGVTALGLLAESHISVHTWPELGYAAADVFTCGEHTLPVAACEYLAEVFEAQRSNIRNVPRGAEMGRPAARLPCPADTSANV